MPGLVHIHTNTHIHTPFPISAQHTHRVVLCCEVLVMHLLFPIAACVRGEVQPTQRSQRCPAEDSPVQLQHHGAEEAEVCLDSTWTHRPG